MMKKLVALGVLLSVCAAIAAYVLTPPEARPVAGTEARDLLRPLAWVKPSDDLASRSFRLVGEGHFPELAGDHPAYELDVAEFVKLQKAPSFRQAQLRYFSKQVFDIEEARYRRSAPHPSSWGPLPYPPLRKPPADPRKSVTQKFSEHFLSDPAFQARLDQLTGSELTRNQAIRLHQNGEAFPVMKGLAERAKSFLFVNMLSVTCDEASEPLLSTLESRARQQVDVRLLVNKSYAWLDRACLKRLERGGVSVVRGETHASYVVSDQDELMIGSESIARMFARSDGYGRLDRDLMLYVKGPLATDALHDFLSAWEESRSGDGSGRPSLELVAAYKAKKARELEAGVRGPASYSRWLKGEPEGLCRFAGQKPGKRGTAMTDLMIALTKSARNGIFLSGVQLGESPVATALNERAREGLPVDFLGNGWEAGNGELTMLLDEWIEERKANGQHRMARALELVRDRDRKYTTRNAMAGVSELVHAPGFSAWAHFNFLHYKAWSFDHHGVWVGSANPDRKGYEKFYEAGALCLDSGLARDFAIQREIDLANSVPYPFRAKEGRKTAQASSR
jgi:phosphatidylserine/phosphatidylglycerophosphate/cardiolipin synthase-like enzyme